MSMRIGIDVGGTFTDVVAIDQQGRTTITKAPTTPDDQSRGVLAGLENLAGKLGLSVAEMLGECSQIVHGTTVATNALLERKGARVGLLTTEGHRDVLEMREGLKPDRYNLRMAPPEPLIPRNLRLGIAERMGHDGRVMQPLDEDQVIAALEQLRQAEVTAIAVAYLHSYCNPAHEQRTAELIAQHMPGVYCSLSSEVLPQIKEYERFSTTVVNAHVGPVIEYYLTRLDLVLAQAGFSGNLFVILSHGGIVPIAEAIRLGAATILSGPAGGIVGAQMAAKMMGLDHVLPFDMGGTSSEISLVVGGNTAISSERLVGGERIALRSFEILSIGAGGGSIASVDMTGRFDVGPESAGAWPGPVCYGQGGTKATVTDANLMLGYLDPDGFRGGQTRLDVLQTEAVLGRLGQQMDTDAQGAAEGIFRLVNAKMADGFRLMTIRRGVDPRRFALLAFGGAAGIHATAVARDLGVSRVLIPRMASVLSAWGMLASALRYETSHSFLSETTALDDAGFASLIAELRSEALMRCGFADRPDFRPEYEIWAEMRYGDQIFEIDVPISDMNFSAPGLVRAVEDRFHQRHKQLFTYSNPDHPVELVNLRMAVIDRTVAGTTAYDNKDVADDRDIVSASSIACRSCILRIDGEAVNVMLYDYQDLRLGQHLQGPAIINFDTMTVLLLPGDQAVVTPTGWLDISVLLD